jgi:phosphoglycerate dehydrogenase-like enzyme
MNDRKPKLFFAIPDGPLKAHMFTSAWQDKLSNLTQAVWNDLGRDLTSDELAQAIRDQEIVVTGWGSPKLTEAALDQAKSLRLVVHSAGTVRWLVDPSFFSRGITLTNANLALAPSVSEYCLMTMLMARWEITRTMEFVKKGGWQTNNDVVPGLAGARVGLIGYGAVAQGLIRLLAVMDVEIMVCSDHCSQEEVNSSGFKLCTLEEALSCDIVSLHRTLTEKTRHMIGARELSMIPDGGLLINTARGALVDEKALIEQLRSGRIHAVLDVLEQEPLAQDHPLRHMQGVIVTPHSAGTSLYMRRKMAELTLTDIRAYIDHKPLRGVINLEKYNSMTPL